MTANFDPDSLAYHHPDDFPASIERKRQRDLPLIEARAKAFADLAGPCVGDFVIMPDGGKLRFTYDWGNEIQTTHQRLSGDQSFHLFDDGRASFSGSLNPAIAKDKLVLMPEREFGWFWSFSNNEARAHNGVRFRIKCRVFKYIA